jgi:thiamine-monophosphate kinase
MKSGARQGDIVAVTGPIGLAAAGFEVLLHPVHNFDDLDNNIKEKVIKHALEPEARLKEGIIFSKSGSVSSATDITDGILSELGEIIDANEGNIGIILNQEELPIPKEVFEIAKISSHNPIEMATTYGEDFELLLTVHPSLFNDLNSKVTLHKIGLVDSSGKIKMIDKAGNTNIITPRGYEHLK